jgi:GMP synthase-like glutamine amidotransferase
MSMAVKVKRTVGYSPWGWKDADLGPFSSLFTHKRSIRDGFKDIDCLLLWGGEDIHPSFYGEPPHKQNETQSPLPSERDIHEWKAMLYCKAHNVPMIGVCRGAQFICAFAGGKLAQDVDRHHGEHPIRTLDGRYLTTTSVHHQMMNPYQVPHHLLAWAYPARSNFYEDGHGDEILDLAENHEPEVVFFPQIRGLAIQGHPEYSHATHEFKEYCVDMAKKYLFNEELQ